MPEQAKPKNQNKRTREAERIAAYLSERDRSIDTVEVDVSKGRIQHIKWGLKWMLLIPLTVFGLLWLLILLLDLINF